MPIGKYKNFAACVKANSDKKDPKAYCAAIERKVKEGMPIPIIVSEVVDVSEAVYSDTEETGMRAKIHLIKAGRAKGKNRVYTKEALQKAVKEEIYDGLRMFVNHSDKPPTRRNLSELVSAVESTEWNEKNQSVDGDVKFFDRKFFEYAQAARKHIGVSADHRIRVNMVHNGKESIENVQAIIGARSVDWVVYPAAGGGFEPFVHESEGEDEVEWGDVTLDQLKSKAPAVLEQYKAEIAAQETEDDEDEDPKKKVTDDKTKQKSKPVQEDEDDDDIPLTKAQVRDLTQKMVKEQIEEIQASTEAKAEATKAARTYFSKSGLPARVQARLVNNFSDSEKFDEKIAKEAVDDAKAELEELGLGKPHVNLGPSRSSGKEGGGSSRAVSVMESVEAVFEGPKKKATKEEDSSEKES